MANGFLSQLAAARAGGQATGSLAGLQIRRTGLGEMRTIEDEIRTMEEKLAEEEESARKREGRRGRGRLAGAILGGGLAALTGGASLAIAAGAGLGSAAGQELGSRYSISGSGIKSRKRYLDKIRAGLDANEGMFHRGRRKDVDLKRNRINKFLRDADRQFDQRIFESSIGDALSAYTLSGGNLTDIFGKEGAKNVGASSVSDKAFSKKMMKSNPLEKLKSLFDPKRESILGRDLTLGGYGKRKGFGMLKDKLFTTQRVARLPGLMNTEIPNYLDVLNINKPSESNVLEEISNILGGIK